MKRKLTEHMCGDMGDTIHKVYLFKKWHKYSTFTISGNCKPNVMPMPKNPKIAMHIVIVAKLQMICATPNHVDVQRGK
jgi:hypothetical protein